jgi:hypothetical protein
MSAGPRFREDLGAHLLGAETEQFGLDKRIFLLKAFQQRLAVGQSQNSVENEFSFFLRFVNNFLRWIRVQSGGRTDGYDENEKLQANIFPHGRFLSKATERFSCRPNLCATNSLLP